MRTTAGLHGWRDLIAAATGRKILSGPYWRLDYLFGMASFSWVIHIVVVSLTASTLNAMGAPGSWTIPWLVSMLAISVAMLLLALNYGAQLIRLKPSISATLHSAMTSLIGLLWGGGAIICASEGSFPQLSFYTLVLGGTALAAVSSQHTLLRSCLLSLWTSVPLLSVAWMTFEISAGSYSAAAMMILFGLMLSMFAVRMNHFISQNVELTAQLVEKNNALVSTTEALSEAQKEKSRFLAQASHDLRQPIHAIGLFIECLKGADLSRENEEVLENVGYSVDSLARLCRSLLDLSALDIGRVKPKLEPVPLQHVLGEVVRQAEESARKRNVTLNLDETREWVNADPALLHTMVQNLVSNAIKYAPGSIVTINVEQHDNKLAISVSDTGAGIAETDQALVFKEFTQVARPDAGRGDGLGLGLSIVRRLADIMGLSIDLQSSPGAGARFTIANLDLAEARALVARPTQSHESKLKGVRVLIVDDDEEVLTSTSSLFSRWGCEVLASSDFESSQALENVDFILSDFFLQNGRTGVELIRDARLKAGRKIPAAILTGGDIGKMEAECHDEDILLLSKPLRPAQLRSALITGMSDQS